MSAAARRSFSTNVTCVGATTQGLDSERTGAGVSIEDTRPGDARRQDVEQRLAQLVGRGPDAFPLSASSAAGL